MVCGSVSRKRRVKKSMASSGSEVGTFTKLAVTLALIKTGCSSVKRRGMQ